MLALISILLLLMAPLAMLALRLARRGLKVDYLITAGTTLTAWLVILLARLQLPTSLRLVTWQPDILFPISPALLVDEISWSFAAAWVTLLLGSVLTDIGRIPKEGQVRPDWRSWSSSLAVTAIALLAIFAGNLLTLLLSWAAIDITELLFWLARARQRHESERVVLAYSARIAGLLVVIGAGMAAYASGSTLAFTAANPQISVFLLIAVGLRLGILPPSSPLPKSIPQYSGRGAMLRFAPAAASLALLPRTAVVGAPQSLLPTLLVLAGLAALYGGLAWLSAEDETEGQPYWLLGMSALALAAASKAQVEASLAWSITTLLSGGLIFLTHARRRQLLPIFALGLVSLTALPYTPAWQGVRLYSPPFSLPLLLFLLGHALFLSGFARHSLREGQALSDAERWVWLIYPGGLMFILIGHFALGWWTLRQTAVFPAGSPSLLVSWPGPAVLLLVALIFFITRRNPNPPVAILKPFEGLTEWLYRAMWGLYYALRRVFRLFSTLLEGRAGLLWTLLLLVLLASFLSQAQ